MAAIAVEEPHEAGGKQCVELSPAFVRGHAVGVKRVGSSHDGARVEVEEHDPSKPEYKMYRNLGTGQPKPICERWNRSTL